VPKPWGYEIVLTPPDFGYAAKLLAVRAGARLSLQFHTEKCETLCLVQGRAVLLLEAGDGPDTTLEMEPQRGYTVAPGRRHRITALVDALIFEASTPEVGTTVRIQDDYDRCDEILGTAP
jgi:mannose-6-phosphate isomerase-like protein (cupin superfamily)